MVVHLRGNLVKRGKERKDEKKQYDQRTTTDCKCINKS